MAESHSTSVDHSRKTRRGPTYIDLTGRRFGRLLVAGDSGKRSNGRAILWRCKCDCEEGKEVLVIGPSLKRGKTQSCGCLQIEKARDRSNKHKTHGMTSTPEYKAWLAMKHRCYYPKDISYSRYGARGITVCDRWLYSFENFYVDMGSKPSPKYSIERKDNSLGYSPDNCIWATAKQQARNRRDNRLLTFQGVTKTIAEWAETLGIQPTVISNRIADGWSIKRTLTEPINNTGRKRQTE